MDKQEYFASDQRFGAELERLQAIEGAKDPNTRRHLLRLGVGPGMRCLEVAGGGGSVAAWMADQVIPGGEVTAIDIETNFLDLIDKPNLTVRCQNILTDPVEEAAYDIAHCRLLLIHLPDAATAVAQMKKAVRPGGWVMVEEADFSSYRAVENSHPAASAFTEIVRKTFNSIHETGVFDPYYGTQVCSLLEDAELNEVASEGTAYVRKGGSAEAREHRLSLPILVDAGVLSKTDAEVVSNALCDPTFTFVGPTIFSGWGQRPS